MTEAYFSKFREKIVGIDQSFETPYGEQKIVYADWIASGRLYSDIEDKVRNEILPFVGNTHTETTVTGTAMTRAYHHAKENIKKHVNAKEDDVLLFAGSGMTGAITKLQRILGLKVPDRVRDYAPDLGKKESIFDKLTGRKSARLVSCKEKDRPIVFITHMEHHSNHTSWMETIADLEIIQPDDKGEVDLDHFAELLKKYRKRKYKIASVTACSNVTGIETPYKEIAKMIHAEKGMCFVDFACSGPYVEIDMHPEEEGAHLDAVFISPHKFLGGPGTPGIAIFNSNMYHNRAPDVPGGGTVVFTSPFFEHRYTPNIEDREDGGTPPFIQGIRAALAFNLKAEMGVENMIKREHALVHRFMDGLGKIEGLSILAGEHRERLGAISFCLDDLHFNLAVRILNDRYGIQSRGGCACAGTYGHYLLNLDVNQSKDIESRILSGDLSIRPGWVRVSIHPTMLDEEVDYIVQAIQEMIKNADEWSKDYQYNKKTNEYDYIGENKILQDDRMEKWFSLS